MRPWYWAFALCLSSCATEIYRAEIKVDHPKVNRIVILDHSSLQKEARNVKRTDTGDRPSIYTWYRGLWRPSEKTIYLEQGFTMRLLRHELCHAITSLTPRECHNLYP